MQENLAEILDRVAYAADWQRKRSERAANEARQAHDGTGDFKEVTSLETRNWFEGHACGINGARRDAADTLDSIAVALAAVIGTAVPDAEEAHERTVARAKARIAFERETKATQSLVADMERDGLL